ncbi:glycosyltransferase family 2 protein [Limnohabitans radicicola]|uniref:Glycosyltransferase family 2 protein n=1 Tax=Limnohabitans radicicola TaxID=2771427 RepID=A0A927FGS5_9BURK|nr:glycosyltransferase family 2 protein [Limnohabitans radicicola]MBD8049677.1 glycosyltransferase family 2 protein [Limnohabitans radicicola]
MKTAVVIPAYKVTKQILSVLEAIGPEVSAIYVVDDCCPDASGSFVKTHAHDPRIQVLSNLENKGVGGAVITGYLAALNDGSDIMVKIDGDGQMDPSLLPQFIAPILQGQADYTKGNRFFDLEQIHQMPTIRLIGNAVLSFMSKLSTGYWDLFDPTNGYTAIHRSVALRLPYAKISQRYFFETDMLFRLNTLGAVVVDIPMDAKYGDEESSLKIGKILPEFLMKHTRNLLKRIFYNYYLRDMSIASVELPIGLLLLLFGLIFGSIAWITSIRTGVATSAGTVMLSALPLILGLQFILAFLANDMSRIPKRPLQHIWKKSS